MHLDTPTRLVEHGQPVLDPEFAVVMKALYRRINALLEVHHGNDAGLSLLGELDELEEIEAETLVNWVTWERTSNRQNRRHAMGGLVGQCTYYGRFRPEWLEILAAGQLLHLGKAATFGMGGYRLELP